MPWGWNHLGRGKLDLKPIERGMGTLRLSYPSYTAMVTVHMELLWVLWITWVVIWCDIISYKVAINLKLLLFILLVIFTIHLKFNKCFSAIISYVIFLKCFYWLYFLKCQRNISLGWHIIVNLFCELSCFNLFSSPKID